MDDTKVLVLAEKMPQNRPQCLLCYDVFASNDELENHLINHKAYEDDNTICKYCAKQFSNMRTYVKHVKGCQALFASGKSSFKCEQCGKEFQGNGELQTHLNLYHQTEDLHLCPECGKSFINAESLQTHARTHKTKASFKCQNCNLHFVSQNLLKKHRNSTHKLSSESFQQSCLHDLHPKNQAKEDSFSCKKCFQIFRKYSDMEEHTSLHKRSNEDSPKGILNSCLFCEGSFSSSKELRKHLKTHTFCPVCNKSFTNYRNLINHFRIHTGEKPFECSVCGKLFNDSANHQRHVLIHTDYKPFQCYLCEVGFSSKKDLKLHIKIHEGEKPFLCSVCRKAFSSKGDLQLHCEIHSSQPYSYVWKAI